MRFSLRSTLLVLAFVGAVAVPLHAAPVPPDNKEKTAPNAEKLRKALDLTKEFDIDKKGLASAVGLLAEQGAIPLELHPLDFPNMPNFGGGAAAGGPGAAMGQPWDFPELTIKGKLKVRTALKKALEPHGMTYVILEDKVYITVTESLPQRQIKQKVSLTLDAQKLSVALKQLAKDTATNIVLDPKVAKDGDTALTVELDEVTLDTAVKVLAATAGLSSVRLGNVLFVTNSARAKELRAEANDLDPPPLPQQFLNMGGQMFGPPAFRLFGQLGVAGQIGFAGGFGGGGLNLGGAVPPGPAAPPTEEKKDDKKPEEKKDDKKPEKKSDNESSLSLDANTGVMAAALVVLLTFTGFSTWWTRRYPRKETTVR